MEKRISVLIGRAIFFTNIKYLISIFIDYTIFFTGKENRIVVLLTTWPPCWGRRERVIWLLCQKEEEFIEWKTWNGKKNSFDSLFRLNNEGILETIWMCFETSIFCFDLFAFDVQAFSVKIISICMAWTHYFMVGSFIRFLLYMHLLWKARAYKSYALANHAVISIYSNTQSCSLDYHSPTFTSPSANNC